ncbi:MAG: pyruvate ferredoxin oxidoreductase [Synergistaceae bacterium]|jgi:pyruvate ferredoxin oxidoreductase beta subunit|nr:pyruvate ferredoxin oxidoreductase [Synergistaceae bacterium]
MSGVRLKDLAGRKNPLTEGHRMCPGCGSPTALRQAFMGIDDPVVVVGATGCMEVSSTVYPYSAWRVPFMHVAFENAAAAISGVAAAHEVLARRGAARKDIKFVAFGGDGGTYDIGLQALSGALERGHDFTYICYNNQGYMNTGAQRSGATPRGANATTSPAGRVLGGKLERPKNMTEIAAAHDIPYAAQTTLHNPADLISKVRRAVETPGPAFVNVLTPCALFWKIEPSDQVKICSLAADTRFWPVYEVIDGRHVLSYTPKNPRPLEDFLRAQGRYAHLFKKGEERADLIAQAQRDVDEDWEKLLGKCSRSALTSASS